MSNRLTDFWKLLETNFPIGGPRQHLIDLLGGNLISELEMGKLISYQRMSDTYPCPHPGGDNCPRQVIEMDDGTYHAVCGNNPRECDDLVLEQRDVEHLGVDPKYLCENVAKALQVRPRFEEIDSVRGTYRVGTFIPDAGVHQPVFLVVRCSERDYAQVLDALRSSQERDSFAVLISTDRFISNETTRQMASLGIPLLSLDDAIGIEGGKFTALIDPLTYFSRIGQRGPGTCTTAPSVVAQALTCDNNGKPTWHDLDDKDYQNLIAAADDYLIFADECTKTVTKGNDGDRKTKVNVKVAYFRIIQAAVSKTAGYFDPNIEGPADQMSDKQNFQRARPIFDVKRGKTWALFKSVKVDNHTEYHFNPDPSMTFAFVFLPAS